MNAEFEHPLADWPPVSGQSKFEAVNANLDARSRAKVSQG
jgi:hypothetical protein